jgi:pyruvate,water dikinase
MTTAKPSAEAFPVTWTDPGDEKLTWHFELEHAPDVATPLGFDLYFGPMLEGFGWARASLRNYYVYVWYQEDSYNEVAAGMDNAKLAAAGKYFWDAIVPEVEGYTQRFLRTDFDKLSDDDLTAEIEQLPALRLRMGRLHTLALFPHGVGMRQLIELYKELVDDNELDAVRLMHGFGNKSVEAGRALWELSRQAAALPAVRDRIATTNRENALDCIAALRSEPSAREFVAAFESFLDGFGWRTDLFELAQPTWAEDPTIPLCQMRTYLEMPDHNPEAEQERLTAEREAARAEVLAKLSPEDARKLRETLETARHVVSLQEDHNFYIDQRCAFAPRRAILAAGRRLVSKKQLSDASDVFHLTGPELLAALRGELRDAQSVADRTKAEMARWSQVQPPAWIGAPPTDDQSAASAPLRESGPRELTGNGASPGVARGPARVLMSLAEADRFRQGDVLVARTTMPAWTPLFAPAAAIITETGGVLSHAAVTAREYGTPAVLNVREATSKIRDGQIVEVDGTQGIVRLVS